MLSTHKALVGKLMVLFAVFVVYGVTWASPMPLTVTLFADAVRFEAQSAVKEFKLQILSLGGQEVIHSGFINHTTLDWRFGDQKGRLVANGVYLYAITVRDQSGKITRYLGKIVMRQGQTGLIPTPILSAPTVGSLIEPPEITVRWRELLDEQGADNFRIQRLINNSSSYATLLTLDNVGKLTVSQVCLNGDCRSLWPSGTVTSITAGAGLTGGTITTAGTISLATPTASTLGGVKSSTCSSTNKVTGIDTSGTLTCAADVDTNSGGDITSVNAGTGLTGGSTTGDATLSLMTCSNNGQILKWNGSVWACASDDNNGGTVTSITAGAGLTGGTITTAGTVALATPTASTLGGVKSSTCSSTNKVTGIDTSGALTCGSDVDSNSGGTVTQVNAGTGLTGGSITTVGTIALATPTTSTLGGVKSSTCSSTDKVTGIDTTGALTCAADVDTNSGGTVTSVSTGFGLNGGPITTSGSISVDTSEIQARVSGTCTGGSAIQSISSGGGVTCSTSSSSGILSGSALQVFGPSTLNGSLSVFGLSLVSGSLKVYYDNAVGEFNIQSWYASNNILVAALNTSGKFSTSGGFAGVCRYDNPTSGGIICNQDLAEAYASAEPTESGDLVVLIPEAVAKVRKSVKPYEELLAGVVSTNPGLVFDNGQTHLAGDNSRLVTKDKTIVALVGRVLVKVSLENGPINAGDPLTSSSTPGTAMKATQAGKIIGYALDKPGTDGKILVFLQWAYYIPPHLLDRLNQPGEK